MQPASTAAVSAVVAGEIPQFSMAVTKPTWKRSLKISTLAEQCFDEVSVVATRPVYAAIFDLQSNFQPVTSSIHKLEGERLAPMELDGMDPDDLSWVLL